MNTDKRRSRLKTDIRRLLGSMRGIGAIGKHAFAKPCLTVVAARGSAEFRFLPLGSEAVKKSPETADRDGAHLPAATGG